MPQFAEREPGFVPDEPSLSNVKTSVVKMYIMDWRSKSDRQDDYLLEAQYNPDELAEELKITWARMEPPGLPHRPLHYTGTENVTFSFTLTFDGLVEGMTVPGILRARRFLKMMCYPKKGADEAMAGDAPVLMFVWPSFLRLTAVITELAFKYESFNREGTPTRYTVGVKLEGVRDVRLYGDDVMELNGEDID